MRPALRVLLAVALVAVGALHFIRPLQFEKIVPPWIPASFAVIVSGIAEILGGVGLLVPQTRKAASYGLVLLFISVFPANIYMAMHPELSPQLPVWGLWFRLPFQALFIVWAIYVGREEKL